MRCSATVLDDTAFRRTLRGDDHQCLREAIEHGFCRQHANFRWCQTRGCEQQAWSQEGDWWFCRKHGRLWADHNRIVERVLRIDPRP